jgi:hypothetical protein
MIAHLCQGPAAIAVILDLVILQRSPVGAFSGTGMAGFNKSRHRRGLGGGDRAPVAVPPASARVPGCGSSLGGGG